MNLDRTRASTLCLLTLFILFMATGLNTTRLSAAQSFHARFQNKVQGLKLEYGWSDDGQIYWYKKEGQGEHEYLRVNLRTGETAPLFDHRMIAATLEDKLKRKINARQLPLRHLRIKANMLRFDCFNMESSFQLDSQTGDNKTSDPTINPARKIKRKSPPRHDPSTRFIGTPQGRKSPDGKWALQLKDNTLWLAHQSGETFRLVLQEKASLEKTSKEKAVKDETKENWTHLWQPSGYWSPDSKQLILIRKYLPKKRRIHMVESSPKDQLQPRLHALDYTKPGDDITSLKPILLKLPLITEVKKTKPKAVKDQEVKANSTRANDIKLQLIDNALFPVPWRLSYFRWDPDSSRFTFLYNQRGHQVMRIIAIESKTGKPSILFEEKSDTFIDYAYKTFYKWTKTGDFIWMSERSGWNHLYLVDGDTGKIKHPITHGDWLVRKVTRVNLDENTLHFTCGAYYKDQDPYYLHAGRADFGGKKQTILTEGDGTHTITFSPDEKTFVTTFSRIDQPPVFRLKDATTGRTLKELSRADWSDLIKAKWPMPRRFTSLCRHDENKIHGLIYLPSHFNPNKKYPVIEAIYAGPHGQFVPKSFRVNHGHVQEIAEAGFIVVRIDGMGTNWRHKAFHNVCWKKLSDGGFPDRIAWMKAAQKKWPQMDLSRVGIYGGSAGGQNALSAALHHGEFYKAAAADCGCHDNRMDKIWWNEAWMSWPIGDHYKRESNVTHAGKLKGALLLTVGELDRNVDPASTMQVVDALIKADKDFDLIVFPGKGHGIGESKYGRRRRLDFFKHHLKPESQ